MQDNPIIQHLEGMMRLSAAAVNEAVKMLKTPPENMTEKQAIEYAKQMNNPAFINTMKQIQEKQEAIKSKYEEFKKKQ